MFSTLFINVFTVFLLMFPGYIVMRKGIIKEPTLKDFSQIIVKVLYPCLIFSSITSNFTVTDIMSSWQLPVAVFLLSIIGLMIGLIVSGFFKDMPGERKRSMLFQFTFNNYSFLPLAIVAKLFAEQYVAALVVSTLGAELTVWTIGVSILRKKEKGVRLENLKNLLSPPLVGIYLSFFALIVLMISGTDINSVMNKYMVMSYIYNTIDELGKATIPLSMIMVGGRIAKINYRSLKAYDIWVVSIFRLILIPFVAVIIINFLFEGHRYLNVILIVAVMPNAISSMVFGELFESDKELLSGTVLITHLLGLITIPLWLMFIMV